MRKTLFSLFLGVCSFIYAQEAHHDDGHECGGLSVIQQEYTISFGEKIQAGVSGDTDLSVTWNISPQNGVKNVSGTGMETGEITFNQPGVYQIQFNIPAHGNNKAKVETSTVKVSDVRMTFDLNKVTFSKSGNEMLVPVSVESFNNTPIRYTMRDVQTTGVSRINISLDENSKLLKKGANVLKFSLSGAPTIGNTQFRIYDNIGRPYFINKTVQ